MCPDTPHKRSWFWNIRGLQENQDQIGIKQGEDSCGKASPSHDLLHSQTQHDIGWVWEAWPEPIVYMLQCSPIKTGSGIPVNGSQNTALRWIVEHTKLPEKLKRGGMIKSKGRNQHSSHNRFSGKRILLWEKRKPSSRITYLILIEG